MRIHEFVDEGLGHSSYVIDLDDGTAAIVDPPCFPIADEQLADKLGLEIAWTIDTHSHADYVTGSPGLVARRAAVFVAPAASQLETPHRRVVDGEIIKLAPEITLTALATPGHTPDHHAYVLTDHGRAKALFSGGSLMVGTVGRTDLCGPDLAVPLAHEMFRGLRRFDTLPDTLAVYPTHGAGSFCSAPGASQRTSTLAHERDTNPLFSIRDEDAFVEQLVAGFGSFPTYFARLPEVNRLGPARYDTLPTLAALTPDDVERHLAAGGVVVDARPAAAFSTRPRPRLAVEHAAPGVRQLARMARRTRPATGVRPRPRSGPRRSRPPVPRRRPRTPRRRARRWHRRLDGLRAAGGIDPIRRCTRNGRRGHRCPSGQRVRDRSRPGRAQRRARPDRSGRRRR